jgi:hypothetical protein
MYTGPGEEDPDQRDAALLQDENERTERVRRRNRASWVIVAWVMAGALALLSYDSGGAAVYAHRSGRPWIYPAIISAVCFLALCWLVVHAVRRWRDRVSHRGPA